jgi:hypothetical protein
VVRMRSVLRFIWHHTIANHVRAGLHAECVGAPVKEHYRNVWSAAELQAKNADGQVVCANVFGLCWSR